MTTYSFDVFDTCLIRNVALPSDISLIVAERFKARLKPVLGSSYQIAFRNLRLQAEKTARGKSPLEDITLEAIWAELTLVLPVLDRQEGMMAELSAERDALYANPSVLSEIRRHQEQGHRVIYISDTCLSAAQLSTLLTGAGYAVSEDTVYTSADAGLLKGTASLFRHVLEKERCRAQELFHTGDNPRTDVRAPRSLGIGTRHITDTQLTRLELGLLDHASAQGLVFLSRLVGEMRRMRLGDPDRQDGSEHQLVASFMGPVLFLFARWIADRARADGVERLHFMSRDGYRLHRVALQMPAHFAGIECRYFYASRRSLNVPSLRSITPSEIGRIVYKGKAKSLSCFLDTFEMDIEDIREDIAEVLNAVGRDGMLRDPKLEERLIELLCRPPLQDRIAALVDTRRRTVQDYLESEGLFDGTAFSFVDIGWNLTSQTSLNALLHHKDPSITTRGYYLAIDAGASFSDCGAAEAIFYRPLKHEGLRSSSCLVFERRALLEGLLGGAPHGSVEGYAPDRTSARPVYQDVDAENLQCDARLTGLSEEFAQRLDADVHGEPCDTIAEALAFLIRESIKRPDRSWLSAIGSMPISAGAVINEGSSVRLHRSYGWRETLYGGILADPWPELHMAVVHPVSRFTFRTARLFHKKIGKMKNRFGTSGGRVRRRLASFL